MACYGDSFTFTVQNKVEYNENLRYWQNAFQYATWESDNGDFENSFFSGIAPCSTINFNQSFGEVYSLHLYGFLFCLFFDPENGSDVFLRNISWLKPTTWHYIMIWELLLIAIAPIRFTSLNLIFNWGYFPCLSPVHFDCFKDGNKARIESFS
jgi:hypothetical protein